MRRSGTLLSMITPSFIPGLELCRRFYLEVVRPLLDGVVPGMPHSAARLGSGSEVLGFDTARSADHEWGPRLQVFLPQQDVTRHGTRITALLSERLPKTFSGYPTHFAATGEPGIGVMRTTDGPVHHRVEVTDLSTWFTAHLGFDPGEDITLTDWLAAPTQRLAEVTAGGVFHDGLGHLVPARAALDWYPHDLWLYLLACQWQRISQEEAFVGGPARRTLRRGADHPRHRPGHPRPADDRCCRPVRRQHRRPQPSGTDTRGHPRNDQPSL